MSWISGTCIDEPTLLAALLDLAEAAFEQGRAIEAGDKEAAGKAHRQSLAAVQAALNAAGLSPS
jgi:hypothetical protein